GYAVWITSTLPFIFLIGVHARQTALRLGAWALFLGNLLAILLTFSRGGLLAAVVVLCLLLFQLRKSIGLLFMLTLFGIGSMYLLEQPGDESSGGGRVISFAGSQRGSVRALVRNTIEGYEERVRTLQNAPEEIQSAVSRIHFWRVAIRMFEANP